MRSVDSFAFVKGIEVRNHLFYGMLCHLDSVLPIDHIGHLALYICSIRLMHHGCLFGKQTSDIAHELFVHFYRDHELFYSRIQNFKLHLHFHYATMYKRHGAFANVSCLGPEDLIGAVSKNVHGTKFHGESICYYYNIEFYLHNKSTNKKTADGPFDVSNFSEIDSDVLRRVHLDMCGCVDVENCCIVYRRLRLKEVTFHSLIYQRRQSSISYFVQYSRTSNKQHTRFGIIEYFVVISGRSYAYIRQHKIKRLYSDTFLQSSYYFLLRNTLDALYFCLEKHHEHCEIAPIECILNHCIITERPDELLVTNYVSYQEHDWIVLFTVFSPNMNCRFVLCLYWNPMCVLVNRCVLKFFRETINRKLNSYTFSSVSSSRSVLDKLSWLMR